MLLEWKKSIERTQEVRRNANKEFNVPEVSVRNKLHFGRPTLRPSLIIELGSKLRTVIVNRGLKITHLFQGISNLPSGKRWALKMGVRRWE